ncbi:hypothetical protein F3J29_11860 [Enterobacter sp. Cy-643]|uniref:hypothetical protein n=1 Tax=Enterobacter sp. Cy-643 TaxID=2608346 RepID=UPI0014216A78|nr:hypothetical protein [Enterobacter sp. Cy-643]NIF32823.1 hypothetical protein [Enterobacter sp. Cy-643]
MKKKLTIAFISLVAFFLMSSAFFMFSLRYQYRNLTCAGYYNVHSKNLNFDSYVKNTWNGNRGTLNIVGLLNGVDGESNNIGLTVLFDIKHTDDVIELTATSHDLRMRKNMSDKMSKEYKNILPPFFWKHKAKIIYTIIKDNNNHDLIFLRGKLPVFYCNSVAP